jgi:hypothetical protein
MEVEASHLLCNLTYTANAGFTKARRQMIQAGVGTGYLCYDHMWCILDALRPEEIANMNTASVIMELTPTILASLQPTVADISVLSLHRPILVFLLSLGSPELYLSHLIIYEHPQSVTVNRVGAIIVPKVSTSWAYMISLIQYLLAFGAAFNVLHLS